MRAVKQSSHISRSSGVPRAVADFVDLDLPADEVLRNLGKDPRLVPYGGANFGTPMEMLDVPAGRLIARERFFLRSNGPVPVIDPLSWRCSVYGNVATPLELSLADLERLPHRRLESFLECAGNGRTRFEPLPPGTPWRNDAVGNAVWEGVPLADVLELAGVRADTVDVVSQGADFPEMRRGLPLPVALNGDVLLAWRMNDEPLPVAHGGPVRLLVPGWAGIASTKWLQSIEALPRPFDGFWNTDNYVVWDERGTPLRPVAEMPPKSLIVTPSDQATIQPGETAVSGWAWSGYGQISSVEVSTDAGQSWAAAVLAPGERHSWRHWEFHWLAAPGEHSLHVRATDTRRLSQPVVPYWNAKGYLMNAIHSISVRVEP
jgi:DMSO/TMAO reductase YedYZ molybdopterin-dependent catalytic subunit